MKPTRTLPGTLTLAGRALLFTAIAASLGCETAAGGTGVVEPKFSSLYDNYLTGCKQCHAPGAVGATSGTEKSLNFSSNSSAFQVLTTGKATGLTGNQAACNGMPFIVKNNPGQSLLMAALDPATRTAFDAPGNPGCDNNAISDMGFKLDGTAASAEVVAALKTWIANGAAND